MAGPTRGSLVHSLSWRRLRRKRLSLFLTSVNTNLPIRNASLRRRPDVEGLEGENQRLREEVEEERRERERLKNELEEKESTAAAPVIGGGLEEEVRRNI